MKNLHFDKLDTIFLNHVNGIIERKREECFLFHSNLHPNGIICLDHPKAFRLALATINLLDTLEEGRENDRLRSLRAMRDEVLVSARTTFRNNTGRVLIQIMKDLIRAYGDHDHQLMLAHNFCQAATGKPRVIRRLLRHYNLLEMPEEWNQLVFDHHVHDANTKGRKNPTHLIMDAWVKGIRELTVIYYNYVTPQVVRELLISAQIMGMKVKIGILFSLFHNKKFVDFIWIPKGFPDVDSFVEFLAEPPMQALTKEAQKASKWMESNILLSLNVWNNEGLKNLENKFSLKLPLINKQDFLYFARTGQVSMMHLAEFIHNIIFPILQEKALDLSQQLIKHKSTSTEHKKITEDIQRLDEVTSEYILDVLLFYQASLSLYSKESLPNILKLTPFVLLDWISSLRGENEITLNLASLTPEDVLTILWDCQGLITHLEIFNLKDTQEGTALYLKEISTLQQIVNLGSIPQLKQYVREIIRQCNKDAKPYFSSASDEENKENEDLRTEYETRKKKLEDILHHTPALCNMYKMRKLRSRIGTDATDRAGRRFGMGLAYAQTLPARVRKSIRKSSRLRLRLPLRTELLEQISYHIPYAQERASFLTKFMRRIPGFGRFGLNKTHEWIPADEHTSICDDGKYSTDIIDFSVDKGNIITLGELSQPLSNGFVEQKDVSSHTPSMKEFYINTNLSNTLKVLLGFIPAMIAFQITQGSVSILAWIGAPLWFLITGLRNIIQAVLGGGGLRRSPLLHWNKYVSWSRLCDSLMYTGLSVLILELALRYFLLGKVLLLNAEIAPVITFTSISLANGLYIASHNYFRGLQKEVIIGNIFRSFLAIPIALAYNMLLMTVLKGTGVENWSIILISSSAIISKMASDTVAGIIEGVAERKSNMQLRRWDYHTKNRDSKSSFFKLEIIFPEDDALTLLNDPHKLTKILSKKNKSLLLDLITHALDYMYFYYYQPRARTVLKEIVNDYSTLERLTLYRMQCLLIEEDLIVEMLKDGLVGDDASHAISFYLKQHKPYLEEMKKLCLPKKS